MSRFRIIPLVAALMLFSLGLGGLGMAWAEQSHEPAQEAAVTEHAVAEEGHEYVGGEGTKAPLLTPAVNVRALFPMLAILAPLLGALGILLGGRNPGLRKGFLVGGCGLSFIILLYMFYPVIRGVNIGGRFYQGLGAEFSFLPGFPMTFKVDAAALVVALVTSFLWLVTAIYSMDYMKIEGKEARFAFFSLLTLSADLGVLLAGDFLTLFFFFEGLVIFPYVLLAHREDEGALRGANNYLYLGLLSGLSLILGIMLLYNYTGSVDIKLLGVVAGKQLTPSIKYWITALMIAGFGVKAGIIPLHIWMPTAYPKAPNTACALSSGGMIKAGAYGIFRVVNMLFVPQIWNKLQLIPLETIGYTVIWIGTVTMFLGVLCALISENSNRMLGFHSVSQMGYIVMGIGCAAYMGADGAMGLAGALYHIVNHALFKASLFLCVGAVFFHTRELNMYKLGGLWRNMPVAAIGLFIAVCGISGIPGFNGFASKTMLHHAILEAYEHSAQLLGGVKDIKLKFVEIIFMLTAAGTFASNIKLFMLIFMGKRRPEHDAVPKSPRFISWAIIMLSVSIVLIGLFPNWLLNNFIGPALGAFNFNPNSQGYQLIYNLQSAQPKSLLPLLYTVGQVAGAWSQVLHNLTGVGTAVLLGGMYFIPGIYLGWFHIQVPLKLQFEYYYVLIFRGFKWVCLKPVSAFSEMIDRIVPALLTDMWLPLSNPVSSLSARINNYINNHLPGTDPATTSTAQGEESVSRTYTKVHARFSFKFERPRTRKEQPWQLIVAGIYLLFSDIAAKFDFGVLDRIVNEISRLTHLISKASLFIDTHIIEGIINGTVKSVDNSSNLFKRAQTGRIQNYLFTILLGLLAIVTLYVWELWNYK